MFYYLLYNSSFSFIVESRLFSTILYGSILYIITHAILNFCDISILNIINNYYWTIFTLDIISFCYSLYQTYIIGNEPNNLNVSFNLLKNKINTMLDRKNDLTITEIPQYKQKNISNQNYNYNKNQNQNQNQNQNFENINNTSNIEPIMNNNMQKKFSTPISQLQNQRQSTTNNKSSTPISLIRNNTNVFEPHINEDNFQIDNQDNNNYEESNTGSDVGSVMDLTDFETIL